MYEVRARSVIGNTVLTALTKVDIQNSIPSIIKSELGVKLTELQGCCLTTFTM